MQNWEVSRLRRNRGTELVTSTHQALAAVEEQYTDNHDAKDNLANPLRQHVAADFRQEVLRLCD